MVPTSVVRTVGVNPAVITRHRVKANVNRLFCNAHPETFTAHESTCRDRLPYEIVELIIARLTRDLDVPKARSLTCRSWYIFAVPHLHHTHILRGSGAGTAIQAARARSNIPRKKIRVDPFFGLRHWFMPQAFSRRDLRYFSAFANVQTLKLGDLENRRFIPEIERYFENFSPTLRSIVPYRPHCTPRQLSHFLSSFQNLDNVKIGGIDTHVPNTTGTELVPFPAPKPQGQLGLYHISWAEAWAHLITSCDGLQFHHMDLCYVVGWAPALLEARAKTLESTH